MKYRQWKKNYKKKHGTSPPLELDKKKQRKLARRIKTKLVIVCEGIETFIAAMNNMIAAINRIAASLRGESEDIKE